MDLIDRSEVLYKFAEILPEADSLEWYEQAKPEEVKDLVDELYSIVLNVNRVDAEPVMRGKWKCVNDDEGIWMCTNCGNEISIETGNPVEFEWFLCPHCGAYLGGKKRKKRNEAESCF